VEVREGRSFNPGEITLEQVAAGKAPKVISTPRNSLTVLVSPEL